MPARQKRTLPTRKARRLISHAIKAPNAHNTQPWRFTVEGSTIRILPDEDRALPAADPDRRELLASLGCAAALLEVAGRHEGYSTTTTHPGKASGGVKVTFRKGKKSDRLFRNITERRTNRGPYLPKELPEGLAEECRALCEPGVKADILTGEDKEDVAEMVLEGDAKQFQDKAYRRELGAWLGRGVMGGDKVSNAITKLVVTHLNPGKAIGKKEARLIKGSPAYAVLSTDEDGPAAWTKTGASYARIALHLTAKKLASHPMNQGLTEVEEHRRRLAEKAGRRHAQLGFRLGHPAKRGGKKSPRRPVGDVMNK